MMKDMHDNIKRDRILGLAIGLIGLVALFYFDFDIKSHQKDIDKYKRHLIRQLHPQIIQL